MTNEIHRHEEKKAHKYLKEHSIQGTYCLDALLHLIPTALYKIGLFKLFKFSS